MAHNYSPHAPQQDDEEDEEEEYEEEAGGGNRLLGFMFGNVDNTGDLDVDYLDEDAKEHLAALADQLGSSLTEIDLAVKHSQTPAGEAEQDYDEKAEDAVDYEDIDEQYEGPEIQAVNEEDHLLSRKDYYSAQGSLLPMESKASVFDDDDYDEEEEEELELELEKNEDGTTSLSDSLLDTLPCIVVSGEQREYRADEETCPKEISFLEDENVISGNEEEEVTKEPLDGKASAPLPVLCIEGGMVILRFSEIFGIYEPPKRRNKRDNRHFTHREKYKSLDVSEIVEEDEESFLKCSGPGFSIMHQAHAHQEDINEEDFEIMQENASTSEQHFERGEDSGLIAEPVKDGFWEASASREFLPLDQQDWEDRIVWGNSPDQSFKSYEISEYKETEMEMEMEVQCILSDSPTKPDKEEVYDMRRHMPYVSLESLGSKISPVPTDLPTSEIKCHPQLLRLGSQLNEENPNNENGNATVEHQQSNILHRFGALTLQNKDMMTGSWLDNVIWEKHKGEKPKLILDLQDEQMLFEVLDNKDSRNLRLHSGAMIITRSIKSNNGNTFERAGHKYKPGWQFNIANDKFYMNGKASQRLQSNSNKRSTHGIKVHHSAPALKLQTMKLKLSNKDIANFHRPKALWYPHDNEVAVKEQRKLPTQGSMKIILKSLGGKGSKLHVDAEEIVSSVKEKASKKLDFRLSESVKIYYLGKELEDHISLSAQNVQPNSLLHLVRTKLHLLPRAQKVPGENKALRPPGAFKKKSDLSVKDGHIFLMEYCEERPLLLSNAGMGANLCTYHRKSSSGDQNGTLLRNGGSCLGNVLTLEPGDKSPFLGDIKPGCSQSSLETNMYKAPVFPHKVPTTDFLLVRSAKGKLSIRRIDKVAVVGQQEPHMEVMSPGSKNLNTYIMNRLLVYVYREYSAGIKRGFFPPGIGADELSVQFPYLSETIIRKKLKECAFLRRDKNGWPYWSMKRDFHIPSEGDLRKMVLPEHVCAYESMQAGLYRLKHLGITKLTLSIGIASAMTQLPDEAIPLAAASHIERELQITPWNLSSNFVACTNQEKENIERLEISGVGDPTGRGLGFSYVRVAPKASVSSAEMVKKKAAAPGSKVTSVTGTDADLRRLSMEAAREVLLKFNVADAVIGPLTRWDRIALIRKLSSEQPASGVKVDPSTISKYARGQRMSYHQLQQQSREKCQEIWDRQVQSLSAIDADDYENESDNSDLDSFAGDLENLLDAEGFEQDSVGADKEDAAGLKGIKMRRPPSQALAQEEIEDEATEAAELCRLLMDGDATEQKTKKKKKIKAPEDGLRSSFGNQIVDYNKKPPTVTTARQVNVSALPNRSENAVTELIDVDSVIVKKKKDATAKAMKKNVFPSAAPLNAKVKILGDGFKLFKEKKSSRESFVCGACGQLGHMRTNKNCPRYGEDPETLLDVVNPVEKPVGKPTSLEPSNLSQIKTMKKKLTPRSATKPAQQEVSEPEKLNSKTKVVPVKFKCGSTDKVPDKIAVGPTQSSEQAVVTSSVDTGNQPVVSKVNKIIISSKVSKPEDVVRSESSQKPLVVIRPPTSDMERGPPIIIKAPGNVDREAAHKPSIVIRPPAEKDVKKIVIKRPKERFDVDVASPDSEYRKTKKITELSSFGKQYMYEESSSSSAKRHGREERRWLEEEEKRRRAEILRKERARRLYEEEMREEQERLAEISRYEESIRREREEEERQKAKNKQKKKKQKRAADDYFEDYNNNSNSNSRGANRNDNIQDSRQLLPDRGHRGAKRRHVVPELGRHSAEHVPPTKRRRGGEVGLANVLESIVETLKGRTEISYLFLKPVLKKEAPDYLDIIERPMDLSTIREKVRRMEYKDREDFRHDVFQISFNAHTYNDGRNPGIPPLADQLLELCDYLLDEYSVKLTEAEAGIGK
ncbi:hypothetical protein ACFE04_024434 [Oxalis oulophora]